MSNNHFHSSADLSLSQSAASDANQTYKMIESQRSSHLQISKNSLPQNYSNSVMQRNDSHLQNHNSNVISYSASSKGTPQFQHGLKSRKTGKNNFGSVSNSANSNNTLKSKKKIQNDNVKYQKQSTKRKPQNTPMVIDFQVEGAENQNLNYYQSKELSNEIQQFQNFKNSDVRYAAKSMKAQHKKNQPSMSSNTSSAQQNSQLNAINKHLRFDSVQDSSSHTNHQMMSITSQHYQGLISGSSDDNDNDYNHRIEVINGNRVEQIQEFEDENDRNLREMMQASPQQQSVMRNQITLSNSLLECVDQYGNNIEDQYSVLMESDNEDIDNLNQSSSKKELVSELNDPNSYLNTVTKDLRALGSINQEDMQSNIYNQQFAYIASDQNFVVCSPSANTDDDCQYTNSSALRSIGTANSAYKNQYSNGYQRSAQLIYTDERKEEDLSSQAIDEMNSNEMQQNCLSHDSKRQECQFSSEDKDQFTGDNEEDDEEIESKLNIVTGSSQIYKSKDYQDKISSSYINDSSSRRKKINEDDNPNKFEQGSQTPAQQHQYFQVLDSESRQRIVNDTPQVMEMIDQSNLIQQTRRKTIEQRESQTKTPTQQISPEVLGSRENRRRIQMEAKNDHSQKDVNNQTRNSSRYLNFKDISPLVKSCNTFAFENTLPNQSTIEPGMMGKISPPFLANHCPSVIQRDGKFRFNQTQQSQNFSIQNNGGFMQTMGACTFNRKYTQQHYQTTTQNTLVNINDRDDACSPSQKDQMSMTNKLSSMIESPPPLTDMTPEKGIKDFNRKYLGQGMWPSKAGQQSQGDGIMNSRIQDISFLSSNRVNNSMKIGDQIKRLENQMSSISKKIYLSKLQHERSQYENQKQQNQIYQSVDAINQTQQNYPHQNNGTRQQRVNSLQEQINTFYPNIDASIVQKINTTLDNMNNQFYFKRPSDHIGLGNSSITQLRTSRDHSKANISGINLLNNFNQPNQIGSHQPNTMANNTVFNQSSFDDICNIHGGSGDHPNNQTNLQIANDIYFNNNSGQMNPPLTSRSNNNNTTNLNQSKLTNTGVNTSTISISNPQHNNQRLQYPRNSFQEQQVEQNPNRLSNLSDKIVKQVTLNGFGLGTINQRMQGTTAGTTDTFNTFENNENNANIMKSQQLMHHNQPNQIINPQANHKHFNQESLECCKDCFFEKEKRLVTQKAFERALGISLFLMEEIDKINLRDQSPHFDGKARPSNLTQSTLNNQLHMSRQEIANLMNQTQMHKLQQVSPSRSDLMNGNSTNQNSQTRLTRSKSQSIMPAEFANLQRSLQIPRGGFTNANNNGLYAGGIFNNITPNMSYI